ncbi:MAG: hypothetical protein WC861_04470, partial [Candidatus Micrarchaeia archaeon]
SNAAYDDIVKNWQATDDPAGMMQAILDLSRKGVASKELDDIYGKLAKRAEEQKKETVKPQPVKAEEKGSVPLKPVIQLQPIKKDTAQKSNDSVQKAKTFAQTAVDSIPKFVRDSIAAVADLRKILVTKDTLDKKKDSLYSFKAVMKSLKKMKNDSHGQAFVDRVRTIVESTRMVIQQTIKERELQKRLDAANNRDDLQSLKLSLQRDLDAVGRSSGDKWYADLLKKTMMKINEKQVLLQKTKLK